MNEKLGNYFQYRRYFVDLRQFYQKKQVRAYAQLVLSITTITFFLVFAIRPTLITIAGLFKEIESNKTINQKLQNKINALNLAQIEYQSFSGKLHFLDEGLPDNSAFSLFIRQLEAIANKNNVAVNSIQYDPILLMGSGSEFKTAIPKDNQEVDSQISGIGFTFDASGDYQSLKSFLGDLQYFRRLTLTKNFIFQNDPKEERLTLNIEGKACYLPKEFKDDSLTNVNLEEQQ